MDKSRMTAELAFEEGEVKHSGLHVVYQDHLGFWTLGRGRLVDRRRGGGLSDAEVDFLLSNDIDQRHALLQRVLPVYKKLSDVRQRALLNMAFQMGIEKLLTFKKMLSALEAGDWLLAEHHALDSKWAREDSPARARRVAESLRTGKPVSLPTLKKG